MRTIVVTPTYNERECLERLVRGLRAAVPDIEILVVDDGSPDGTAELATQLGDQLGGVDVLRRPGKAGLASAYIEGFRAALLRDPDRIVQMDADLSHAPADVARLLACDADLVLGSRYVPGGGTRNWPLHRRVLSRGGSLYARRCLGLPYRDLTGGFKAWRAPLLRRVLSRPVASAGYAFQVELTLRAHRSGAQIHEVPILFTERVDGSSKMSSRIALEAVLLVPMLRLRA